MSCFPDAGTQGCTQGPRSSWQWAIMHIQTWQESKAHKKGHQNTFLTIFMCFRLFFVSAETLHALSPTFNRFQAPTCIPEFQHVFSSWLLIFNLFSTTFNYFQLFFIYISIRFHLFSIDFIHFRSSLFVFDCFYPLLLIFTYFLTSISIIFIHFPLY